jgi:hypothetical protein
MKKDAGAVGFFCLSIEYLCLADKQHSWHFLNIAFLLTNKDIQSQAEHPETSSIPRGMMKFGGEKTESPNFVICRGFFSSKTFFLTFLFFKNFFT